MIKLAYLRRNEKFVWNNKTYTVYDHDGDMTEVFGNGKWCVWWSNTQVKLQDHGNQRIQKQ